MPTPPPVQPRPPINNDVINSEFSPYLDAATSSTNEKRVPTESSRRPSHSDLAPCVSHSSINSETTNSGMQIIVNKTCYRQSGAVTRSVVETLSTSDDNPLVMPVEEPPKLPDYRTRPKANWPAQLHLTSLRTPDNTSDKDAEESVPPCLTSVPTTDSTSLVTSPPPLTSLQKMHKFVSLMR